MDAPYPFRHELDPDLFALDRVESLIKRAPAGAARVVTADGGRERTGPPAEVALEGPLAEAVRRRPLHARVQDLALWADEYRAARDQVLEAAGVDPSEPRYGEATVIRVFSPDAPVGLHGDGETQINCGVGGRSVWHVYTPSALSQEENEALLRGGQFVGWREMALFASYDLRVGDGFAAPPRWPHWIEHPGPEPAVSFEFGFWTVEDVRARKVWDVNWMLRRARLSPRPPGEAASRDRVKRRVFDAVSRVTGKGAELRGL